MKKVCEFSKKIGQAQGFQAISELTNFAKLQILKEIQETKAYQEFEGLDTMDDVIENMGLGKSTAYHGLKALKTLGEKPMELLMGMGVPIKQTYLISKGIEDRQVEFEMINPSTGEFRLGDEIISATQDPEEFSTILSKALNTINRQATTVSEQTKEIEKQKAMIIKMEKDRRDGEEQLRKIMAKEVGISRSMGHLYALAAKIELLEMTEEEEAIRDKILQQFQNSVVLPLQKKFGGDIEEEQNTDEEPI